MKLTLFCGFLRICQIETPHPKSLSQKGTLKPLAPVPPTGEQGLGDEDKPASVGYTLEDLNERTLVICTINIAVNVAVLRMGERSPEDVSLLIHIDLHPPILNALEDSTPLVTIEIRNLCSYSVNLFNSS